MARARNAQCESEEMKRPVWLQPNGGRYGSWAGLEDFVAADSGFYSKQLEKLWKDREDVASV